MIQGKQIGSGSDAITVAPMNLRIQLETCKDELALIGEGDGHSPQERIRAALTIILACAKRNHPDLTEAQLCEQLDSADVWPLMNWVFTKSGFREVPLAPSPQSPQADAT